MEKRSRRKFTKEFKAETVTLIRRSGKSIAEVCREMGLPESSVHRWLAQADIDTGQRDGLTTAEREELLACAARAPRRARRTGRTGKSHRLLHQGHDPVSRYRFIAGEKAQHSVVLVCRVLGVAKSAFYTWQRQKLSARAQADEQLTDQIKEIYDDSRCTYGAPRVHAELRNRGKRVGRKRVARLMRKAGLVGRCPRRFRRTTNTDPSTQVQDLVQRQFRPTEPNQLWLSDITYIRTWEGWLYLAVILDAFSRKVVGWALADHLRTELATAALQMALTSRRPPPGLIQHSDRGSQYTSAAYGDMLAQHALRQSIGRPGTCWDNAVAESFFATLKKELIYPHIWPTRQSARKAIFAFIEGWYNRVRLHSTLKYSSPHLYEEDYYRLSAAA